MTATAVHVCLVAHIGRKYATQSAGSRRCPLGSRRRSPAPASKAGTIAGGYRDEVNRQVFLRACALVCREALIKTRVRDRRFGSKARCDSMEPPRNEDQDASIGPNHPVPP